MAAAPTTGRVLDLTTSLAGAYAARLLTSAAADVTRVDPPGGHQLRRWSASHAEVGAGRNGALFEWLAGGQAAVSVDPDDAEDVAALAERIADHDVVLWDSGSVIDLDAVTASAGQTTVVTISPFGLHGPWADRPATEFTLQAMSGAPALRGSRSWPPMTAGGRHGEYMIGVFTAVAAMLALRQASLGTANRGGVIDVSGMESLIMSQLFNPLTMETQANGVRPRRPKATVADVVPSADGFVGFAVVNRVQHWHDFCNMIGQPDWAADSTLNAVVNRTERSDELNPVIERWTQERSTVEIVELANLLRIPCIEVGNGETIPSMDQFADQDFFVTSPATGGPQPAAPFRLHPAAPGFGQTAAAPPIGAPIRTAPRPGRAEVAAHSASDAAAGGTEPVTAASAEAIEAPLPLRGVRVGDFTSFWAGPFLAHTMAMFGADVIHVESTARPDGARLMNHHPTTTSRWWERSPYFHATNTNKRGVTIDLSAAAGRELALQLVDSCDVVVENYSPRVFESFGLSWDELRERKPGLVMVRMPAFGLSGPWRDRTGFAMTMEQVSGMAWLTGFPEHNPGALFGPCDPGAGLHALIGLLAALDHRARTGEGRLVECPMVLGALNVAAEQVIEFGTSGVRLDRMGNRGIAAAPQNCYPCADQDPDLGQHRFVAVAVENDTQWRGLCEAVGNAQWTHNDAFGTAAGRRAAHDELDARIGEWCAARSAEDAAERLLAHGVPAAVVVHPSAQMDWPQLHERGFFETVDHPVHGESLHVTYPFTLPGMTGPIHRRPAPLLGEHNREIFVDELGLSPEHYRALEEAGVIGTALG